MRILIDTNVLISAALFPNSVPARAYAIAMSGNHVALVCEQNIEELSRIFSEEISSQEGGDGEFFGFFDALMGDCSGAY